MSFSRRGFLLGAAALLTAFRSKVETPPILYGDGQHDDTRALQALIDGKPVVRLDGAPVTANCRANNFSFPLGTFRVSRPINLAAGYQAIDGVGR